MVELKTDIELLVPQHHQKNVEKWKIKINEQFYLIDPEFNDQYVFFNLNRSLTKNDQLSLFDEKEKRILFYQLEANGYSSNTRDRAKAARVMLASREN